MNWEAFNLLYIIFGSWRMMSLNIIQNIRAELYFSRFLRSLYFLVLSLFNFLLCLLFSSNFRLSLFLLLFFSPKLFQTLAFTNSPNFLQKFLVQLLSFSLLLFWLLPVSSQFVSSLYKGWTNKSLHHCRTSFIFISPMNSFLSLTHLKIMFCFRMFMPDWTIYDRMILTQ